MRIEYRTKKHIFAATRLSNNKLALVIKTIKHTIVIQSIVEGYASHLDNLYLRYCTAAQLVEFKQLLSTI